MKKKKWLIPVAIFAAILILAVVGIGIMIAKGYGISTGRYLEAKNGSAIFVRDNSPIVMSNRTDRELFNKLDVGDKILVIHDGINETYPGGTGAYAVFKLRNGTTGDIPQMVVNELIELGWLDTEIEINTGGTYVDEVFDISISYANWGDSNDIYAKALNTDKMMISSISSILKNRRARKMNEFYLFGYQVEIDKEATKDWYDTFKGWRCDCEHCQNFLLLAKKKELPNAVLQTLGILGVLPEKPTYVCEISSEEGQILYQFSYRIAGNIIKEKEGFIEEPEWGEARCCHEIYPYGAPDFPTPHFDLGFWIRLPWILKYVLSISKT